MRRQREERTTRRPSAGWSRPGAAARSPCLVRRASASFAINFMRQVRGARIESGTAEGQTPAGAPPAILHGVPEWTSNGCTRFASSLWTRPPKRPATSRPTRPSNLSLSCCESTGRRFNVSSTPSRPTSPRRSGWAPGSSPSTRGPGRPSKTPRKEAKYIKSFALHIEGEAVYAREKADALEAELRPLVGGPIVAAMSKHDTNPANNPQPPKRYRA